MKFCVIVLIYLTAPYMFYSWALDGFKIYGRHLSVSNLGYSSNLDDCGGHTHGTYGYHYHSQVKLMISSKSSSNTFYAYIGGVYKCWKGDITNSHIFDNSVPFGQRADYEDLKPCCDSSKYWTAPGISASYLTASSSVTNTNTPTSAPTSAIELIVTLTMSGVTKEQLDGSESYLLALRSSLAALLGLSITAIGTPTISSTGSRRLLSDAHVNDFLNLRVIESWRTTATSSVNVVMTVSSRLTIATLNSALSVSGLTTFTNAFMTSTGLTGVSTTGVSVASVTTTSSSSTKSSTTMIIIVIVCSVGGLLLVGGLYYVYRANCHKETFQKTATNEEAVAVELRGERGVDYSP